MHKQILNGNTCVKLINSNQGTYRKFLGLILNSSIPVVYASSGLKMQYVSIYFADHVTQTILMVQ
jgi:uncharacterized membrane protein